MKFRHNKKIIFVIATVLLLTVAVGTTVAYIVTQTESIVNTFNPSKVTTAVIENGSTDDAGSKIENVVTKSNVKIKNTGDTEAYIRAAVIVTWKKIETVDGITKESVYAQAPTASDYNIDWTFDDNSPTWVKGYDGYYYFKEPVKPGKTTDVLINSCSYIEGKAPDGYSLSVEILGSGIQSTPASTVINTWGPVIGIDDNGYLVVQTTNS